MVPTGVRASAPMKSATGAHYLVLHCRMGCHGIRVITPCHAHRPAGGINRSDDSARVEVNDQAPHVGVSSGRSHHRYVPAVSIRCKQRIRPEYLIPIARQQQVACICQQLIAAPGNQYVHSTQRGSKRNIARNALQVTHDDDLVHARRLQRVDLTLDDRRHVTRYPHVARTGKIGQTRRGGADNADAFAVNCKDSAAGNASCSYQFGQPRFAAEVQVGAENGAWAEEPRIASAKTSGPKSNSWLPSTIAS